MDPGPTADHCETDLGHVAAVTDRGRRHADNQDAYALAVDGGRVVWAVADGVSSSTHPEVAARAAVDAAVGALSAWLSAWLSMSLERAWPSDDRLVTAVDRAAADAERAVVASGGDGAVSATTLVLGINGPGLAVVGSIGDSRTYWIGSGPAGHALLTEDDSWAEEAIRAGCPRRAAYSSPGAHVITRCLRTDSRGPTPPNVAVVELASTGRLVTCSDGLWNYLERPHDLATAVHAAPDPTPIGVAHHLVHTANAAGGADNITVVVVDVVEGAPS